MDSLDTTDSENKGKNTNVNDVSHRYTHTHAHHILSSPKLAPIKIPHDMTNPKQNLHYSWSTPDFSLHSKQSDITYDQQYYQHMLRDIIKADVPMLPSSYTPFSLCPHKHHCLQNAVMKGFFRTFSAAFIFKTSLRFFTSLLRGKISFPSIKAIYLDQDSILFGLFVGLMSFTYKAILCILRRVRRKDPLYHKAIAGFICASWIIMDDKTRLRQIALYCFVRAISDVVKLGVEHKKIPSIPHTDIAVFTASQLFVMHGLVHAPHALDKKYYKWIKHMGHLTEQQCQLTFRSRINPKLPYRLPSEKWDKCYPFFHKDHSCLRYHALDWLYGLVRAARIYFPVHFLPMILFEPKRILTEPISYLRRKSYNVMISSLFLSTYQFNMKMTLCFLRNLCKEDYGWQGPVGGLTTGIALLIENGHRRPELMLYCVPRALEVAFRLIPNKNGYQYVYNALSSKYSSVFAFQIAMSCWMTIIAIPKGTETSNSINMTVLKIIFGSKH